MEKQTKNLGHVTAYGYAKAQGYTGTEEEYAQLMASYSSVAERAEAAAQEAAESAREVKDVIPEVTAQDNGKVMMVENGEWGAGEVDVLPTVTTQDNGKVLGVVEGQWAKTEPEDGLPEVTSSDNGKVLSVVEGAWAPAEPTGGSGLPAVTSEDNGDILSVVDGAWAKSEPGYRVSKSFTTVVPEQSVTTALGETGFCAGDLTDVVAPTSLADVPDKLKVVLNGSNYTLPLEPSLGAFYGEYNASSGPIFTTYPCALMIDGITNMFITPEAGTYTVSADKVIETVTPDDHFKAAVAESGIGAPLVVKFTLDNSDPIAPGFVEQTVVASHTYDEILAEYNKGRPILFDCYLATGVSSIGDYHCYGSPVLRSDNKLWLDAMFPVVDGTTLHIFNVEAIIGSGDYLTVFWTRYTLTEAT